jgi:dCTP deaminase
MLKSSSWIREFSEKHALINPFVPSSIRENTISYGLGPYGYDLRLASDYKKIKNRKVVMDPHVISDKDYVSESASVIEMNPDSYILGMSMEYIKMPKTVMAFVFGKSTYARAGILVNVTPVEPEWEGFLTISISNISGNRARLYAGQGIAQIVFFESDSPPLFSYNDLKGKYNKQNGISISKI